MSIRKKGKRDFSVIVIFMALALLGCALIPLLPVRLSPSDSLPSLTVSCNLQGTSPRAMEVSVTSPLERSLARIKGVRHIRSKSSRGKTVITLEMDRTADMEKVRFEASMIVRQVYPSLPEGASYPRVSVKQTNQEMAGPFLSYSINSGIPSNEIRDYVEKQLSPRIKVLDGVDYVSLNGADPLEWVVEYDPDKLEILGVSLPELQAALKQVSGRESIPADRIFVKNVNGSIIRLSDIATVAHKKASPNSFFRINGRNTVYLNVVAEKNANQLKLADDVKKAIEEASFPDNYDVALDYDATERITSELNSIYFRCGLTVILLLLFILLTTLDTRYSLLTIISLFLSLGISFVFYWLFDVEIHIYSLAAITISLNLIIDNIIVVADQLMYRGSMKGFTAVLAATMTTIGALAVIFFLDEETKLSLRDFAVVVIVNLSVSLLTALFLVPALAGKLKPKVRKPRRLVKGIILAVQKIYGKCIAFLLKIRWIVLFLFAAALCYSVYLFVTEVYEGMYWDRPDREPTLEVAATLPNGSTLKQMNELVTKMEAYIASFEGVSQFQTSIAGARRASISIKFKPGYTGSYPYSVKNQLIGKALTLGGGSWSVYGLEDQGFSNDVRETAGNFRIKMNGSSYDRLMGYARVVTDTLLGYRRIKEVNIKAEPTYFKDDYREMYLLLDKEKMAKDGVSALDISSVMSTRLSTGVYAGEMLGSHGNEMIRIVSGSKDDMWHLMHSTFPIGDKVIKLSDYGEIMSRETPPAIIREDQQYVIYLQYDYIGTEKAGNRVADRIEDEFGGILPTGYSIKREKYNGSGDEGEGKYWLLGLIAIIIFFITSILFNSLRQPLAVISIIPIGIMGVFFVFYLFSLKFDQGGFASLILLSGITVNAALYIVNECNHLRNRDGKISVQVYIRALRRRVYAIFLTVMSTVLGFVPFLIGERQESFWFPLAVGTIGGLLFSMIAVFIILPLIMIPRKCKI